jgi:hypothetical protein
VRESHRPADFRPCNTRYFVLSNSKVLSSSYFRKFVFFFFFIYSFMESGEMILRNISLVRFLLPLSVMARCEFYLFYYADFDQYFCMIATLVFYLDLIY